MKRGATTATGARTEQMEKKEIAIQFPKKGRKEGKLSGESKEPH